MIKLQRIVLNTAPVKFIVRKSKEFNLPGFQHLPLYDVAVFFINQVNKVGISDRASAVAYNFLMALPAATIFLCTLLPYMPVSEKITAQLLVLANDFTPDVKTFLAVEQFLKDFLNTPRGGLLSLGFFLAVIYSSNAMMGIMHTFNKSLVKSNKRNFVESRWMAIKLTSLVIFLVILTLILLITQGELLKRLLVWMDIHDPTIRNLIESLRYIIITALIFYAIAFIYKYAPAIDERWKLASPGTVVATLLTIVTTFLFSIWVNKFGNYNKIYGSIGTIFIIMLLNYINSFILLIGFELNVSIYAVKELRDEKIKQLNKAIAQS